MRDFVTVLECEPGKRLAKRYTDPGEAPGDYDAGWLFKPEAIPVDGFADLVVLTRMLATDPSRCVIRGALKAGALAEWVPRRSKDSEETAADFEPAEHQWVFIDCDASATAFDPADVRGSIEAWRSSLPEALRTCGMIVQLSAKQHLYPYVRCHAWIWLDQPVGGPVLKAWLKANDFDPRLEQCVQVHYTADPVFDGCGDPLAGQRLHVFEGPSAVVDFVPVAQPGQREAPRQQGPEVPADSDVLAVLGDAREHQGRRWYLCGALGGVWRRQFRSREWAKATIEAWLSTVPGDHQAAVDWCLGAWSVPFPFDGRITGQAELALHLGDEWAERVARASLPEHRRTKPEAPAMAPAASDLVGDLSMPPLLSAPKRMMYIRDDLGGYFGPIPLDLMRQTLRAVGLLDVLGCGSDGKPMKDDSLYKCGAPVHTIVRSFESTGVTYDPEAFTLHQGYQLPAIEPQWSDAVHAWLGALAGSMLPNLLDWIALCSQANIHRRAAALVIVGEHSTGKSLIFKCLAQMWGALTYVALKDAAAQFNSTICESPIVCDDECQALKSHLISSEEFRERVQARVRKYEPKGFEKVHLLGYTREGIAANAADEVTIARVTSASTREAIEARLLVVPVPDAGEARRALLAIAGGDEETERATIRGHVAWLWANHEIQSSARFAGAGGAASMIALAGARDDGAEVWDYLHGFLMGEGATAAPGASPSPFLVREGALLCYPQALASMLNLKGGRWDAKAIGRVLGAIRSGDRVLVRCGSNVVRYWPLDFDQAIGLAGVDAAELAARIAAAELAAAKRVE